jgi:hypothetical protein
MPILRSIEASKKLSLSPFARVENENVKNLQKLLKEGNSVFSLL